MPTRNPKKSNKSPWLRCSFKRNNVSSTPMSSWLLLILAFSLAPSVSSGQSAPAVQDWKTHLNRGIEFLRTQKFQPAKEEFLLATAQRRDNPAAFVYLGLASLQLDQLADAQRRLVGK